LAWIARPGRRRPNWPGPGLLDLRIGLQHLLLHAGDLGLDLLDPHALVGRIQLGQHVAGLTIWLSSNRTLVTTPGYGPTPDARGR
jgi:hypothetical protein